MSTTIDEAPSEVDPGPPAEVPPTNQADTDQPGAGSTEPAHVTVIAPSPRWRLLDWRELVAYRDLFRFLVWREVKVRYAQSAIGIGWAVIQPVFSMIVFTIVFGKLAKVESDGAPYALFSLAALVPWTYFSNALTDGTNSLVSNANMLSKVYFPRVLMPLSSVCAKLVDFGIAMTILAGMLVVYGVTPAISALALPLLVLLMMFSAAGLALWLTALAIQYRDVKHGMGFAVQLLLYASPVVYPASLVPEPYRLLFALNPMVGVIEGFRASLLGNVTGVAMPWDLIGVSILSALTITATGLIYFRSRERLFADVA